MKIKFESRIYLPKLCFHIKPPLKRTKRFEQQCTIEFCTVRHEMKKKKICDQ